MPPGVDAALLSRAFRQRDAGLLSQCAKQAPELTLLHLDGSMRGLRDGELPPEQTRWLVDQDEMIRRQLGWNQRLADLQILRAAYRGGDLYLVAGAGISMAAGMPGWKDLVLEVLDHAIEYGTPAHRSRVEANLRRSIKGNAVDWEVERVLKGISAADPALRLRMEGVRDRLRAMKSYDSRILLEASQAAGEHFGGEYLEQLRNLLYGRTLKRTKIHPAIARLVRVREHPWPPEPRIFAVVTYNFDDLIEQIVREAGFGFTVHCSQRGKMVWNRGETGKRPSALDIYHVHGIAPGSWILDLAGVDLVFTAEQYTVQYGEDNFARRVQHSFFRNAPGLILGSSLTDEYAVKELQAAHRDKPGWFNFAVLKLPEAHLNRPEPPDPETLEKLNAPYREMGLRVFWVRDHETDTPSLLDSIG